MKTLFALLFSASMIFQVSAGSIKTVIIDAGHGGHDIGGHDGKVYEKWLALDTAYRLERLLREKGFRTVMTRETDQFISLGGRTDIANRYSNALFISIHFNHTWKRDVSGIETFFYSGQSRGLASAVQEGIMERIDSPNRGVKSARFYVLRNNRLPSILVEGGFVSNARERERMKEAWFREALAKGVCDGVVKFKREF